MGDNVAHNWFRNKRAIREGKPLSGLTVLNNSPQNSWICILINISPQNEITYAPGHTLSLQISLQVHS